MYLYELALELGIRSPELVERAAALGMADVGPGSSLTPAQVAAIRSGVPVESVPAAAMVPPLLGAHAPLAPPPPPPPPLAGPAPVSATPVAPAPFAAPPSALPALSFTDGPPAAPPAGPPPPVAGLVPDQGDDGGQARRTQLIAVAVLAPVIIALFAFMVVNSGPDERREAAIREQAETADEASGPAVAGGLDSERDDTGEEGPDGEGSPATTVDTTGERVEDRFVPVEPEPADPIDPCADGLRQGLAAPRVDDCPSSAPSDDELSREPVDTDAFCASMQSLVAFELELAGAALRGSSLRDVVLRARDRWVYDVAAAFASAPPDLADDLETYREQYSAILLPVDQTTTNDEILRAMAATGGRGLGEAATNLNQRLASECGVGAR